MKLSHQLQDCTKRIILNIDKENLIQHMEKLKSSGDYRDLETRVLWDIFWLIYSRGERMDRFKGYNDSHIQALMRKGLFNALTITIKANDYE